MERVREAGGMGYSFDPWPWSNAHRLSQTYDVGTEHVGFHGPNGMKLLAPSAKRRAVFGESREG